MIGTMEDKQKAAAAKVQEYRDAAALYPIIAKVIIKFDGKVFNKRLQTALQEAAGPKIYAHRRNDYIEVYTYGSRGAQYTIAYYRGLTDENKRIDAEKLLQSAKANREKYLKTAYDIERSAAGINTHIAYIKELEDRLSSYRGALPWEVRDIFELNRRY